MKRLFLTGIFAALALAGIAQVDYQARYMHAKELFRDGKFNLAMEAFKPLVVYNQANPFNEYASFYYALSAYRQGYRAVAKDMLNQIRTLYPSWEKLNEVNFWLGRIHFENRDYFQGLKVFQSIADKKFEKDIEAAKTAHLATVSDVETLKMMYEEYPGDAVIARLLAAALATNITDPENKEQLEQLIERHKLKRADFIAEAPKTIHKDRYAVSVMLPFMVGSLEPTPGRKRNQVVLDFYEGMKLALDTLSAAGMSISLRAYDTERNEERIRQLLETEELKNTDVIVGPLFPDENKLVYDFSMQNAINMIHPFSNNTELIGINPHAYLFQPSSETLGREAAAFLSGYLKEKTCIVFFGPGKQDSVMATSFVRQAAESGLNVVLAEPINPKETARITEIIATPTEFDEFKYPKEFTLKKDSIASIFVASDDPLIYSRVINGVETRGDSIIVVGSENWIDDHAIDFEKFQTLGTVFMSPNYANRHKPAYADFEQKFLREHARVPSNVARMGYEFMLFIGHQLKTNGVYFQEGLAKAGVLPGYLTEGYDFQAGRDNNLIPFVAFRDGELKLLQKR